MSEWKARRFWKTAQVRPVETGFEIFLDDRPLRTPGKQPLVLPVEGLARAGVPVRVMVAPVIPVLTDHEIERILHAARDAGATMASMIPVRLPLEVAPLFRDWLETHHPGKAAHVMTRIQAMRGGRDNDPRFGHRFKGSGVEARVQRPLAPAGDLVQLADLLVHGHALEQVAHARGSRLARLADGVARAGQE